LTHVIFSSTFVASIDVHPAEITFAIYASRQGLSVDENSLSEPCLTHEKINRDKNKINFINKNPLSYYDKGDHVVKFLICVL